MAAAAKAQQRSRCDAIRCLAASTSPTRTLNRWNSASPPSIIISIRWAASAAPPPKRKGVAIPVYIGDQTRGAATVRTLADQVALKSRTRVLNPKWYEGMLKHGHEGVRHIESHLTNTVGWSATTGQVAPWVYQQFTQTYVLDEKMRQRLAALNPKSAVKVVNRLLEAERRVLLETRCRNARCAEACRRRT